MWTACLAALVAMALVSCDSQRRQALKKLESEGIEASGFSLLSAAERGDAEVVKLLLQAGVYSGQRDQKGRTPLHLSIQDGHLDVAWALVDGGADVSAQTPDKITPLSAAVEANEAALADRMLDCGAQPEGLTSDGSRLLPWAIRHGRSVFVKRLMEKGADPHQVDSRGTPLLHVAMESANRELTRALIDMGADCGAANADGESALVIALRKGWRDQVEPLVRSGADPNLEDRGGLTPFERAVIQRDLGLAEELLKLGTVPRGGGLAMALSRAYGRQDREECEMLLRLGADPSPAGSACLIRQAAGKDDIGALHLFLGYHQVPEGLLREFSRRGSNHIVGLLLAHGANPNPSQAPFLETPFSAAVMHSSDRLACLLLDGGASPAVRSIGGQPPLMTAIALRRGATVRRLLEHGANANAEITTPASADFLKLVRGQTMRWLLRKDRRITPLMLAVDSGSLEATDALLDHGAKVNVWTRRSSIWPINIAAGHEDVKMMRLLLGKDPHVEERTVEIRLEEQRLRVYSAAGEEIFETRVSTGKGGYRTPTGEYAITNRYRSWTSTIYHSSMPYFQRLSCRDFGFHQGYVPNYPASHGCIRVPAGNASKLFALTELGDRVRILP
ncbi:ankyrin repeat domain-containing protein [Haloferula sp.]|uniref:ankyrin repeat domain-containing protein n=1 Tax=Haloferula sp. TaxID=2497595 RepID=UPI00329B5BD8